MKITQIRASTKKSHKKISQINEGSPHFKSRKSNFLKWTKFYFLISLVIHWWNLYSPPISNLYKSSKSLCFFKHTPSTHPYLLNLLSNSTSALLGVCGWPIFFLHPSFSSLLPFLFSPLISTHIYSIKLTSRQRNCSETFKICVQWRIHEKL